MPTTKDENQLIKITPIMYIFFHYCVLVWCVDAVNIFCLLVGMKQTDLIAHLISFVLCGGMIFWDRKKFEYVKTTQSWMDCVVVCVILLIGFYQCIYPDTSHDVMTYHYISQEPVWITTENACYYYETSFPFADRMFYLFRAIGGYRLGTMFNAVLYVLVWSQCKRIVTYALEQVGIYTEKIKGMISGTIGLMVILEAVLMGLGTYMSDMVPVPIMLELVCQILYAQKKKTSIENMIFFAVNLSFIFLCKLTGAITIFTLLAMYLFVTRQSLDWKKIVISFLAAVIAILPFVLFNIYVHGVPLHAVAIMFNSYASGNGSGDNRFGPENWVQRLLWPVYMAQYPLSGRHMELIDMPNYYPIVGMIIVGVGAMTKMKNFSKEIKVLLIIAVGNFYLWTLAGGTDRYKLINLFLFGIIICYFAIYMLNNRKYLISILLFFVVVVQSAGSFYWAIIENNNWKWSPAVWEKIRDDVTGLNTELLWLGKDRGELIPNADKYEIFIAPNKYTSAWAYMINEKATVYQMYTRATTGYFREERMERSWQEELEYLSDKKSLYTACKVGELTTCINDLNAFNLVVEQIEYYYDTYVGSMALMKVIYMPKGENIVLEMGQESDILIGTYSGKEQSSLQMFASVSPLVTWTDVGVDLTLYYYENGEKCELYKTTMKPKIPCQIEVDLGDLMGKGEKEIYAETSFNYGLGWKASLLLNPQIIEK